MQSRGKFSLRNASRLFMNTVKVTNRKLPRHSKTMKKMLSLKQQNLVITIQFRCSEQFGGSCLFTSVFGRETKAESCAGEMVSSKKIKMVEKCLFGLQNEARRLVMVKKKVTEGLFNQRFTLPRQNDVQ